MGRKKRPLWKLPLDPTACFCLWLESEGYTSWVISRGIRACSLIKSSRKKVARISNKGLFLSFCLPPDGGSQAHPLWAAPTVLRCVDLWLPGGRGSYFTGTRKLAQKTSLPYIPGAIACRQVSTCFFWKGLPVESLPEARINPEISGVWLGGPRGAWKAVIPAPCGVWESQCGCQFIFPTQRVGAPTE